MISAKRWLCRALVICIGAGTLVVAQDNGTVSTDGKQTQDITSLKAMIAAQQKQLDALKQALDNQQKLLDQTLAQEKTAAQKTTRRTLARSPASLPSSRRQRRRLWRQFRRYRFHRRTPPQRLAAIPARDRPTRKRLLTFVSATPA